MPPKKASSGKAAAKNASSGVADRTKKTEVEDTNGKVEDMDEGEDANTGQKRKSPPTSGSKPPKKEPRQGSRVSSRAAGKDATSRQLLNFLLSEDSLQYCYPEDDLNAAKSGKMRTYSRTPPSLFTPFEHLVTSHLLSKPLSHVLGMRSTRTLLNDPYSFKTPEKVQEAGEQKVWQALEDARTQHRQKTAAYIYQMGCEYAGPKGSSGDSDIMLELATQANEGGPKATISHIKDTVKGMGQTGAEIFCRRVQAVEGWGEALWPYADSRSFDALREIGIKVSSADELQEMIERDVDWDKVGSMGLVEEKKGVDEKDYEVQVAVEFVTVLERAVGCVLENKVSELKRAAADWN